MAEKCSPDDPGRCQGVTPNGQCGYLAVGGDTFCDYHSKGASGRALERKRVDRYMIDNEQIKEAYKRHNNDEAYLDLRDDIALVHAMVERRLNTVKTEADSILAVGHFNALMGRLESMKISLMKLQQQLGLVLGKNELRVLADAMARILDEELEGLDDKEERMDRMIERLFVAVEEAGSPKEKE